MLSLFISLLALPSAAMAADATCVSVNHQPVYSLTAKLMEDGVFKGFHAVEITKQDGSESSRILAIGQAKTSGSVMKIPFFQVNDNGNLRVNSGEFLKIDGASSVLNLQGDENVSVSCQ